LGTLSAREAYERGLPVTRSWAKDVELLSVGYLASVDLSNLMGPRIDNNGRLRPHGYWTVRFLSPHRATYIFVTLPHTGAIRWATFPLLSTERSSPTISSPDWLDSTTIASTVNTLLREHLEGAEYRVGECLYNLGSRQPNSAETVWEVHAILHGKERYKRRDVRLIFDPWNGSVLETHTEP